MIRSLCAAVVVIAFTAGAFAAPDDPKPLGTLTFWRQAGPAGTGFIINDGPVPFQFDGYTIASAAGLISGNPTGIFDNTLADMPNFPATVGYTGATAMSDALGWTELSATATNYTEATLGMAATLQPGGSFNLGGLLPRRLR